MLIAGSVSPIGALAQTHRPDKLTETGRMALAGRDYPAAIRSLERAIEVGSSSAEAHYLLATALLATNEPEKAGKAIRKARAVDPENSTYQVLELEVLRRLTTRETSTSLTDGRRFSLATSILEKDPENPTALEELGLHHAMNYRWHANFDATKEPLGNSVAQKAAEEFGKAEGFLRHAIRSDRRRISAYKELLRLQLEEGEWLGAENLATDAQEAMPNSYEPWLLGGLVAHLQQQTDRAQPLFDRARTLMPREERVLFDDVSLFLNPVETARFRADPAVFVADYWGERDPIRLTDANEREMDHYARLAYCDLWYATGSERGWDTERGQIVLRYGIPWSDASFGAGYSRFNVLEYRDFEFVFEDMTRGGHFSMYSPKAGAGSSWTNDYVIQAGEMAISNPEAYDPKFVTTIELLAETSAFRGPENKTDLYVHFLVPDSLPQPNVPPSGTIGVFLLNDDNTLVDEVTADLTGSGSRRTARGLQGTLSLQQKEGRYRADLEYLPTSSLGVGQLVMDVRIPDFNGDTLMISDVLAASLIDEVAEGEEAGQGRILRSGYSIQAMPWTRLAAGSDLLVYFELYGLETDDEGNTRYRVNAVLEETAPKSGIRRLLSGVFGGSDEARVAASFESSSVSADESQFLSVGLPADGSGDYRFVLEVTDLANGRTVRRDKHLSLVGTTDH